MVGEQLGIGTAFPNEVGAILIVEPLVLGFLTTQYIGERGEQLTAHADKGIARTGEDERDSARFAKRLAPTRRSACLRDRSIFGCVSPKLACGSGRSFRAERIEKPGGVVVLQRAAAVGGFVEHRVDARARAMSVLQPSQHEADRAVLRFVFRRANEKANIARQIDRADDRAIQLASLQHADRDTKRDTARVASRRNREAGAADIELAGQTAGDDAAEVAHHAVRCERRAGGVLELLRPLSEFVRREVEAQHLDPARGVLLDRPSQVEVRRVGIEFDPDKDAGAGRVEGFRLRVEEQRLRVAQRFGSDLQHQLLLREHVLHFERRNAELAHWHPNFVDGSHMRGCI